MDFTPKQEEIINKAIDWYHNSSDQIFQFAGNPGTGKSVVMNEIINRLQLSPDRVAPMAFVGAAAINMRTKGLYNAKTIHSWLYDPIEIPIYNPDGTPKMDTYFNRPIVEIRFVPKDLAGIDLMAIDEAGMVPISMRQDILSRGKKILCCGDVDQLKPVADEPAFLVDGRVHILDQIMRQAEGSAIVQLCQDAKHGVPINIGYYGDVWVIEDKDVTPDMLLQAGVILCGKNVTRDSITKRIRHELLHIEDVLPQFGEKVICRHNNWLLERGGINLTNGLTGHVINQPDVSGFDGRTFRLDFLPNLTNIPFKDVAVSYPYFSNPSRFRNSDKGMSIRYLKGELFEFGYSQTVHLAQGSQWTHGMYFEEYLPKDNERLNYTALSRFSKMCIYVKRSRKYY